MISLSDLKAKRAAMTQGEWLEPEGNRLRGAIDAVVGGVRRQVAQASSEAPSAEDDLDCGPLDIAGPRLLANATGIVATHNAADVLIEIVEAALAYEQAKIDAAVIRYTYATADDRRTVGARRIEAHDRDEIRCREAYRAALAKIKP